jgi:hypothetical protein
MLTYHFMSIARASQGRSLGQSRWVVALPFLIAIFVQLLGVIAIRLLDKKVPDLVRGRLGQLTEKQIEALPLNLQPDSLAQLVDWGIDVSQALGAVCAPVIALIVLLPNGLGKWTAVVYGVTALASLGLFAFVFNQRNASRYVAFTRPIPLTLVTIIGLVLYGAFLGLALLSVP